MAARLALVILLGLAPLSAAADWPQWMGPGRDNVWAEDGILDTFPADGPKVVWRVPVGGGYAGPAVASGKVFCSEYKSAADLGEDNFKRKEANGTETVFALDAATGKRVWEKSYPVRYTISYPAGPRCTPTVHAGKVYFLGAEGMLLCCDADKGDILWQKDLKAEYKTKSALWGYAAHPLIDGQKLITLAGGDGSHVVALDKDTGKEMWRSQSQPEQGYSPPLLITAGGVRQLIVTGPAAVRSLNPETGERYWTQEYGAATSGSIIMTPVVVGEYLFVGGYDGKSLLLKLAADKPAAERVSKDEKRKFLSPVNVQPLVIDGVMYGFDGGGELSGVEFPSGKRLFSTPDPIGPAKLGTGTAFLVRQAGRVWFFTEKGDIVIGKLTPAGYEEVDRANVIAPTGRAFGRKVVWCMPAFTGKQMYVRNDAEMICVDLAR